jgi:hypothetical protein
MEETVILTRALMFEETDNHARAWSAFDTNGLTNEQGELRRDKIIASIRKDNGADLRRLPGLGGRAYIHLIHLLLENTPRPRGC